MNKNDYLRERIARQLAQVTEIARKDENKLVKQAAESATVTQRRQIAEEYTEELQALAKAAEDTSQALAILKSKLFEVDKKRTRYQVEIEKHIFGSDLLMRINSVDVDGLDSATDNYVDAAIGVDARTKDEARADKLQDLFSKRTVRDWRAPKVKDALERNALAAQIAQDMIGPLENEAKVIYAQIKAKKEERREIEAHLDNDTILKRLAAGEQDATAGISIFGEVHDPSLTELIADRTNMTINDQNLFIETCVEGYNRIVKILDVTEYLGILNHLISEVQIDRRIELKKGIETMEQLFARVHPNKYDSKLSESIYEIAGCSKKDFDITYWSLSAPEADSIVVEKEQYRVLQIIYEAMLFKYDRDENFEMDIIMEHRTPQSMGTDLSGRFLRDDEQGTYRTDLMNTIDRAIRRLESEEYKSHMTEFQTICRRYLKRFYAPDEADAEATEENTPKQRLELIPQFTQEQNRSANADFPVAAPPLPVLDEVLSDDSRQYFGLPITRLNKPN